MFRYGIFSFPTIVLFGKSRKATAVFRGERTAKGIYFWLIQNVPKPTKKPQAKTSANKEIKIELNEKELIANRTIEVNQAYEDLNRTASKLNDLELKFTKLNSLLEETRSKIDSVNSKDTILTNVGLFAISIVGIFLVIQILKRLKKGGSHHDEETKK